MHHGQGCRSAGVWCQHPIQGSTLYRGALYTECWYGQGCIYKSAPLWPYGVLWERSIQGCPWAGVPSWAPCRGALQGSTLYRGALYTGCWYGHHGQGSGRKKSGVPMGGRLGEHTRYRVPAAGSPLDTAFPGGGIAIKGRAIPMVYDHENAKKDLQHGARTVIFGFKKRG